MNNLNKIPENIEGNIVLSIKQYIALYDSANKKYIIDNFTELSNRIPPQFIHAIKKALIE